MHVLYSRQTNHPPAQHDMMTDRGDKPVDLLGNINRTNLVAIDHCTE